MKKYSSEYQHKVINKLNKKWSLTDSQKILWDFWVTLWSVTKYFGLRIDFVIDNQSGIINIANKVDNQKSKIWIINIANIVKNQIQKIWIQFSNHSERQKMFLWAQVWVENYNRQKLWFGLQSVKKGKSQIINSWIQVWQDLNWSNQVSTWISLQVLKILTWSQIWNKGVQIADTITWSQLLKKWYQFWKYVHILQKVWKWISVK